MKKLSLLWLLYAGGALFAQGKHVVLISSDGLRPEMYLDETWPTPNLQHLMQEGVYADHMKSVFPAYTYPSHTAMLTGTLPARSGIYFNQPKGSKGEWNWFTSVIKVPTLWQAMKKNNLKYPSDRITETRKYASVGLVEEIERNATGLLDSVNMQEEYLSLDENERRMAAYIFKTRKPNFLALHFACVDGAEHAQGRNGDSVRLAIASADRAIGDVLEAIERSGMKESPTMIIVGDHGFSDIPTVLRPNLLLKEVNAKFITAGGSAFLYRDKNSIAVVKQKLDSLPKNQRKLFRIIDRKELDKMGADSAALLALAAVPGVVFSGALPNTGPGTTIVQNNTLAFMGTTKGGHHGYDPNLPEMYTGFIAAGVGVQKGNRIKELCVTDIAPLVAKLLGIAFEYPDGKLVQGILKD